MADIGAAPYLTQPLSLSLSLCLFKYTVLNRYEDWLRRCCICMCTSSGRTTLFGTPDLIPTTECMLMHRKMQNGPQTVLVYMCACAALTKRLRVSQEQLNLEYGDSFPSLCFRHADFKVQRLFRYVYAIIFDR